MSHRSAVLYGVQVFEPPAELTDADVLGVVRSHWSPAVDRVAHLPVGFGAHHWRAEQSAEPRWFVTYDRFRQRHTAGTLTAAYTGAVELARKGLPFVVAPAPSRSGEVLVPLAGGAISCTPWVVGEVVGHGSLADRATAEENIAALTRLHATQLSTEIPRWQPLISDDLPARLAQLTATPWDDGPYGKSARTAIVDRLRDVEGWTHRYLDRAAAARYRPWVPTHGETHTANQLRTATGIRFVDWESLKLAPRERDLPTLVQAGYGDRVHADRDMVELFDLEWRLSEISEYAAWFAAPHIGTTDDRVAHQGLLSELARPPWWPS